MSTHAEQQQRARLTAVLPELREAFRNRWSVGPALAAHGFDRRLLTVLEHVQAITSQPTTNQRWTRYVWTTNDDDQAVIDRVVDQPLFALPEALRRRLSARYVKSNGRRSCHRCGHVQASQRVLIRDGVGDQARYVCRQCWTPEDEPAHERALEALRQELQKTTMLWPDDLPKLSRQLRRIVGQLHEAERRGRRRGRLTEWAERLDQLAAWLTKADHMLQPHRRRVLERPTIDPQLPAPYELAEVVSEHPHGAPDKLDQATREAILRDRARHYERRRSADLLHQGLRHATEWMRALEQDLTQRRRALEQ